MFEHYNEIFRKRGELYHKAMTDYPRAREEEFHHLLCHSKIEEGNRICDAPSGGGYLRNFVGKNVSIICFDGSKEFIGQVGESRIDKKVVGDFNDFPLRTSSIDRFVSLAGIHHIKDRKPFYREVQRMLSMQGRFCIADVLEGSNVAKFLNIFVNEYNSMGHKGIFINEKTHLEMQSCGMNVEKTENEKYYWKFDSLKSMSAFCKLLFGLDKLEEDLILEGVEKYLGITETQSGFRMNWELIFLSGTKIGGEVA